MSPHVTTYAFPAVAISSITQRVTGVLLSVGVGGVAAGSLAGVDMAALATAVSCYPVKFIVAFPLTYHYAGALRHTLWDRKPETMLNNKDAEKSSYLVMGGSTIVAAGLAAWLADWRELAPAAPDTPARPHASCLFSIRRVAMGPWSQSPVRSVVLPLTHGEHCAKHFPHIFFQKYIRAKSWCHFLRHPSTCSHPFRAC